MNFHPGKGSLAIRINSLPSLHRTRLSTDRPDVAGPDPGGPTLAPLSTASLPSALCATCSRFNHDHWRQIDQALTTQFTKPLSLLKDPRAADRRKMIFLISDGENGKTNTTLTATP